MRKQKYSIITKKDLLAITKLWLSTNALPSIELAALEPTLWSDDNERISDLISELKSLEQVFGKSINVSLTTNGFTLREHAAKLSRSGIDKLRISWHTFDPKVFREITGNYNFTKFLDGIQAALDAALPISINRVLFRDYLNDLEQHIDYIEKNELTLKLYDLYWTPDIQNIYSDYYIHWEEVLDQFILPRSRNKSFKRNEVTRSRLEFHLKNGGRIIVKDSLPIEREHWPCKHCKFRENCLEAYGDYLRIDYDLMAFPCYLRRDLSFNMRDVIDDPKGVEKFLQYLENTFLKYNTNYINESKLRFVLVPYCNFHCYFPGSDVSWCLKKMGDYWFPPRVDKIV